MPTETPTPSLPQADEDLCCVHCEYNLTGLPDNICPECGITIDWATVRAETARIVKTSRVPWETWRWTWKPIAFVLTALETALLPWRFARRVHSNPRLTWPVVFLLICGLWQAGWYACRAPRLVEAIPYSAGALAHVLVQSLVLARILPLPRRRFPLRFWFAVTCYTSYPLLIEAFTDGLPVILVDNWRTGSFMGTVWPFHRNGLFMPNLSVGATVLFYLWWADLAAIAWMRLPLRRRRRALLLVVLIPVMTILSSYAGYYVAALTDMW